MADQTHDEVEVSGKQITVPDQSPLETVEDFSVLGIDLS